MEESIDSIMENLREGMVEAREILTKSINKAQEQLRESVNERLSNTVDIKGILKTMEGMKGAGVGPLPGVDYYAVLGLKKTCSNDEVKNRYKEIMLKLHPDVVGEEMTFFAAMVNTAYFSIVKERGM